MVSVLAGCGALPETPAMETAALPSSPTAAPLPAPTEENFRVFYQIFVGSFSDSDGDGVGDLQGIIHRLDYLNDGDPNSGESLGVQGLWLSPVFESPSYHKYDVQDYYSIDGRFGDMQDLKDLLICCHERDIKVILDLVLNHTSIQNRWFTQFKTAHQRGNVSDPYYDFYSWSTGNAKRDGAAWCLIPGCDDEYYECNFSEDMPELNYDCQAVRERVLELAKIYLDMGVDGFRFDAVKYLYNGEIDRNVAFWKWYIDELRACKPDVYCVGECWSGEEEVLSYYPAMNCFAFTASQMGGIIATTARGGDIGSFTDYVCAYQHKIRAANSDSMPIFFLSNHDMDRSAEYLMTDDDFTRMGASLYLLSPGSPFIYYGEEIAMRGAREADNTDANRRLAMLWGDGDTVKDPAGATYPASRQTNGTVVSQMEEENSLLAHYRQLISLRAKYPEIARGDYVPIHFDPDSKAGGFHVTWEGSAIGVIHNVDRERERTVWLGDTPFAELCEVVGMGGASFDGANLILGAQTTVILR